MLPVASDRFKINVIKGTITRADNLRILEAILSKRGALSAFYIFFTVDTKVSLRTGSNLRPFFFW